MYPTLMSPIAIGSVPVKNRVMQLATRTNLHAGNVITDDMVAFYEERARGGVGSIVVPAIHANEDRHGTAGEPVTFARSNIGVLPQTAAEGLARLVDRLRPYDVALFSQITHGGRQHHLRSVPMLMGPSAVACPQSGGVPHALDVEEIGSITQQFIDAARSLQEVGFHGVEVHAAQGHLIQQFLSRFSNRRDDSYGGSLENRCRLLEDILRGIRDACGPDFVIGVRLASQERSPEGIVPEEAIAIAHRLTRHHIGYLSLSIGNFNSIELHVPDRSFPLTPALAEHAAIRAAVDGVPTVVCGRVLTPDVAEEILAAGQADIIGLSRPLISDPEWVAKASQGRGHTIRKCISCNQCWGEVVSGKRIRCVHNAATGRERVWGHGSLAAAQPRKRVVVVGGGPAGMEAARVCAVRGHDVVLFERASVLGGALALAAMMDKQRELAYVIDYLRGQLDAQGVEVRLNSPATAERVLREQPDAVVVATGSRHDGSLLGIGGEVPVMSTADAAASGGDVGKRVVLLDEAGYFDACEVAEMLADHGAQVTVVTRFTEVGREIPLTARISALRALDKLGVTLLPTTWIDRVEGRTVVLAHYYTGRETTVADVDAIVHAGGRVAVDDLYHQLKGQVGALHRIGDAYMPRHIMEAVFEGHQVGRSI